VGVLSQAVTPWLAGTMRSYWGGIWGGEKLLSAFLSANGTSTTPDVTATTALNLAAFWCGVLNIAGSIATMPLFFYRRQGDADTSSRDRYVDDPRYYMLHERPNPQTAKPVFWETFVAHIILWGNAYAEIVRDGSGRPRELWLIHPSQCRPTMTDAGLRYVAPGRNGTTIHLPPEQVIHVPHISLDGLCGMSVIGAARSSLALTMQAEDFGGQFYSGGSTQRYIARYPEKLSQEAHDRLTATLNTAFTKNNPVVVLEEGFEITTISIPQKDAEYLGTRIFQIDEMARWLNIPPHKLKNMERATWANIEPLNIEYVQDTLEPYLSKIEAECSYKLVLPLERKRQFVEFSRDGRLQGDTAARTAALDARLKNAVINIDEWRAFEGLPPLPNGLGKTHLIQVNQTDLARLEEIIDAQIKAKEPPPAPAPSDPDPDEDDDEETVDAEQERGALVRAIVTDITAAMLPEIQRAFPAPGETPPLVEAPAPGEGARRAAYQRQIAADVARRMLARERDKVRAAAKTPDKLRAWVAGPFYSRHADVYRAALVPVCGLTASSDERAAELAAQYAEAYVAESRRQVHALLDRAPVDMPGAVEALLEQWDVERVNAIPDAILREGLAHA
jgi:HK97 family phage portal protein